MTTSLMRAPEVWPRGRAKAIGHIILHPTKHEMVNVVFADFIAGTGEIYAAQGFDLLMSMVADDAEASTHGRLARKRTVDGVILHVPTENSPRIDLLLDLKLPFVVHGRSNRVISDYSWLDVNNERAIEHATDFLIDLGHRCIALINGWEGMGFALRRRAGYLASLKAHGIGEDAELMRSAQMTEPFGNASAHEMPGAPNPPTAFIASSIVVTMDIRRAVEERGLRLAQIENPDLPSVQELWDAELVLGSSTGPAPQRACRLMSNAQISPMVFFSLQRRRAIGSRDTVFGGAGPTPWDTFAATPGILVRAENGSRACDHYHCYEEDVVLMQAAGFDVYRFSTSRARVLPDGRGQSNAAGPDFYGRLFDAMPTRNLKQLATLYHWELPAALADLSGWQNPDIGGWFADFTHIIMDRIGDRMFSVAPINEPWCAAWLEHFTGEHAPGLRDIRATARAMHHDLTAHGSAIQVMREMGLANLGAVFNFEYAIPPTISRRPTRQRIGMTASTRGFSSRACLTVHTLPWPLKDWSSIYLGTGRMLSLSSIKNWIGAD